MKSSKYFLLSYLLALFVSHSALAQGLGEPFHPMTAPGAKGIATSGHILVWENPAGIVYNEVYFSSDSSLVSSLDTTVRIVNGYPSTTYNSTDLSMIFLDHFKKYYWRIVEYDSLDFTAGPIWNFISRGDPSWYNVFLDDFEAGTGNWNITNDGGTCEWEVWDKSTNSYIMPPEATLNVMAADADYCGSGTTTITTATLSSMISFIGFFGMTVQWDNDWRTISPQDEAYVEASSNGGNSWEIIWSRIGIDERDSHEFADFITVKTDSLLIRFRTIQPGWDWWWVIDNVSISLWGPLSPAHPPNYLAVFADTTEQQVLINWDPGSSPDPVMGYRLERKNGLPTDSAEYITIIDTDANTFNYTDYNVQLNHNYTYRIATLSGPGPGTSIWGNEATAYVPEVIPVELTSFTASVTGNDVHLKWSTATELNNSGFEIQKLNPPLNPLPGGEQKGWVKIGFVAGHGTTTEQRHYSFVDESVSSGRYKYRLKQIDYDGTFEYSDIVEVEVGLPTEFSLEQNYPNPFNPTTKIKFTIPNVERPAYRPGRFAESLNNERISNSLYNITIIVYDVLGNEVATLVNEEKPAGNYEIEWNAAGLSSGIYFYQLKAGDPSTSPPVGRHGSGQAFIETKKMILLR